MTEPTKDDQPGWTRVLPSSGSILRVLTSTQNASAAVFSIFLGIHLTAPIAAAYGGVAAADSVMILGREYYHTFENYVVYAPLAVHIVASISRRLLITWQTGGKAAPSKHGWAGYALIPLVIPHLLLHRIIPSVDDMPVRNLSPSEFGYDFVAHAVSTRAWMLTGYVALSGLALYHGIVGGMKVVGWAKRMFGAQPQPPAEVKGDVAAAPRTIPAKRRIGLRGIIGGLLSVICVGLYKLRHDLDGVSYIEMGRYTACYIGAPWSDIPGLR